MGEMAEYELGMLREDDIEDRIDELRRLLETLRIIEGIIQQGYLKVADFERIERITKRVLEGADGG